MSILDYFFARKQPSASVAKERLQIVLAHERAGRDGPDYLPLLKNELLAVVRKYVEVKDDMIRVNVGKQDGARVLEINIEFDAAKQAAARAVAGGARVMSAGG